MARKSTEFGAEQIFLLTNSCVISWKNFILFFKFFIAFQKKLRIFVGIFYDFFFLSKYFSTFSRVDKTQYPEIKESFIFVFLYYRYLIWRALVFRSFSKYFDANDKNKIPKYVSKRTTNEIHVS